SAYCQAPDCACADGMGSEGDDGCGCAIVGATPRSDFAKLLMISALLVALRRRRSHRGPGWRVQCLSRRREDLPMAKPFNAWTVLPHGKLTRLDDRMLSVTGMLHMPPMGDVERRITLVRLRDGRLVVYSR